MSAVLDPADDSFDAEAWLRRKEREHAREVSAAPFSQSVSQSVTISATRHAALPGRTNAHAAHARRDACMFTVTRSHGHTVTRSRSETQTETET